MREYPKRVDVKKNGIREMEDSDIEEEEEQAEDMETEKEEETVHMQKRRRY